MPVLGTVPGNGGPDHSFVIFPGGRVEQRFDTDLSRYQPVFQNLDEFRNQEFPLGSNRHPFQNATFQIYGPTPNQQSRSNNGSDNAAQAQLWAAAQAQARQVLEMASHGESAVPGAVRTNCHGFSGLVVNPNFNYEHWFPTGTNSVYIGAAELLHGMQPQPLLVVGPNGSMVSTTPASTEQP